MSVAPSSTNGSIKDNTFNDFSIRTLVRSADVADNSIRPLGIEPVLGSLDDTDLITREAADADVVLNFVDVDHLPAVKAILKGLSEHRKKGGRARPILIHTSGTGVLTDSAYGAYASKDIYYDKDVGATINTRNQATHRTIDLDLVAFSDRTGRYLRCHPSHDLRSRY